MEIKKVKNKLVITHRFLPGETYKVSEGAKFKCVYVFKRPQIVQGITSYCKDGMHVLYIDFDDVPLWLVKEDFKRISEKYNLPDSYLIKTHEEEQDGEFFGNYHIVSLRKFYANQITQIISETNADANFMTMPLKKKWRSWVLRIGPKRNKSKPRFAEILKSNSNSKEGIIISTPHRKFFEAAYCKIDYPDNVKNDSLTKCFFQDYEAT